MTEAVLFGALGLGLGAVYFGGLFWNVRLFLAGRGGALPLALLALRLALAAGALWLAARHGPTALLSAFAGFLVMRTVLLQLARRRHV